MLLIDSKLLYTFINASDGSFINSTYLAPAASYAVSMNLYDNKIYVSYKLVNAFIAIIDIVNFSATMYTVDPNYLIFAIYKEINTDRFALLGADFYINPGVYIAYSVEQTFGLVDFVSPTTNFGFYEVTNGSYASTPTIYIVTMDYMSVWTTSTGTAWDLMILSSSHTETDTSFNLGDYYNYGLVSGTNISLDIPISCSISGGIILYTIVDHGAEVAPSWASINFVSSELVLEIPVLSDFTYFTFEIETYSVNVTASYRQVVYLMAAP